VARAVALCEDPSIVGTTFYVMDHVEGRIFWDPRLPEVPREGRAAICDAMNATLAQLHGISPAAAGLADFGKAGNYFARQLARWGGQYRDDTAAGRVADMDRLLDWLQANIPPGDDAALVHGDFRADNMIFHPTEPRVLAVLDWELSTLGHPVSDFAYQVMAWRLTPAQFRDAVERDGVPFNRFREDIRLDDFIAEYFSGIGSDTTIGPMLAEALRAGIDEEHVQVPVRDQGEPQGRAVPLGED
jgi:aminoglycoside phosphotransferase (APT) family kinase protein